MRLAKTTWQWSLAHHLRFGDTDIFPLPFEYEAMRGQWGWLLGELCELDVGGWTASPSRRAFTPKSRFGFRSATQLDPLDSLVFAGLVYEIAKDLERHRDPLPEGRVLSHRVKRGSDGQLYDPKVNFEVFKARMKVKCEASPDAWVVSTDIADFYSRIYHHPLENILRSATSSGEHVDVLQRLISQWNYTVSSGLPVGPAASRILAEMALVDVDRTLVDRGVDFCRFSDDFRLFAPTEAKAHEALAVLAGTLGEIQLSLSERKTTVLPALRYRSRHIEGERPDDAASLAGRVTSILERYGYENDVYSTAPREDLPAGMVEELGALDLNAVLKGRTVDAHPYDAFIVSLSLRRLAQLRDNALSGLVAENLHQFTPVLPQLMSYFDKVTVASDREEIGRALLGAAENGASGHREYQLCWLLHLFTTEPGWVDAAAARSLHDAHESVFVRPGAIQLLGETGQVHWFRQRRRDAHNLNEWELRAFIKGAECMNKDEYVPLLRSLMSRLNLLGQVVARDCLARTR